MTENQKAIVIVAGVALIVIGHRVRTIRTIRKINAEINNKLVSDLEKIQLASARVRTRVDVGEIEGLAQINEAMKFELIVSHYND